MNLMGSDVADGQWKRVEMGLFDEFDVVCVLGSLDLCLTFRFSTRERC